VKAGAAYDNQDPNQPQLNITVDVLYGKTGQRGEAWGTLSYMHRGTAMNPQARIYAHAICVGRFNAGNQYTVSGTVAQAFFVPAPKFLTFEFDIANKKLRAITPATLGDARALCAQQTGLYPGIFNHGYVVAK